MPLPSTISFHERLVGPKELETGSTLQYTCPGGNGRRITAIYLTSDSNARTINLHVVPVGSSATNANKLLDTFATIANDLRAVIELDYPLRPGETIYTSCSGTGTKITIVGRMNI